MFVLFEIVIKTKKAGNFTQSELAKEYNISDCTISNIKTKKTRKTD